MPIIDHSRIIKLSKPLPLNGIPRFASKKEGIRLKTGRGADEKAVHRAGKAGMQLNEDVTVIRLHYGVNVSDALSLALHLTANAIRANKAKVEI